MSADKVDITHECRLDALNSIEVDAVLRDLISISMISPEQPHTAVYGDAIWVTHKTDGGRIVRIDADRAYWNASREQFLANFRIAVSPPKTSISHQVVYSVGGDLPTPPFKWKDEFQLGRIPEGNPKPEELLGLFPCLFQFSVPQTGFVWLDAYRANEYFRGRFLPLLPLLMQFCTTTLLFYPNSNCKKSWALDLDIEECKVESRYAQIGYHCKTELSGSSFFQYSECPIKILPIERLDPYWLSCLHLSDGYRAYENLTDDLKDKFLLGCEWLNKALNASDKTDQTLFLMIMLEIFLPSNQIACAECGQPIYAIAEKFRTYIPEVIGENWTDDFPDVLKKLYNLRSRIAHSGVGIAQHLSGMIPHQWRQRNQVDYLFQLARQFLVSWLFYQQKQNTH